MEDLLGYYRVFIRGSLSGSAAYDEVPMVSQCSRKAWLAACLFVFSLQAQAPSVPAAMIPAAVVSPLSAKPVWSVKGSPGLPPHLVGEAALFIRQGDALKCLSLADGTEIWSVIRDGTPVREEDGLLFLMNAHFELTCLDARTGKLAWKAPIVKEGDAAFGKGNLVVIRGAMKGPVVAGDKVLVGTFGGSFFKGRTGKLYAFDRKDGKLLWSFEAEDGVENPPLVYQGLVLFGGVAACYGLDLVTGKQLWKSGTRSDNQWFFKLAGDTLLVSSGHYGAQKSPFGGTLYAFEATTGRLRWKYDIGGPSILRVAGDRIVGIEWGMMGGTRLTCLNLANGAQAWEYKEKSSSWPVLHNGKAIYITKDNRIHLLDLITGKPDQPLLSAGDFQMGFFKGPWGRFLDPVILQDHPVVGSWDKAKKETVLEVLDGKQGKVLQERRIHGEVWSLFDRKDLLLTLVKEADESFTLQVYGR